MLDIFNVWDVKVDRCKNTGRIKVHDNIEKNNRVMWKKCTTLNLPSLFWDELGIKMSQFNLWCPVFILDAKGKSHELHMCETKLNSWKILRNLAKTWWRPQVVEPAMAVKDRIRVAKGRILISSSIRSICLRDTNVFFFLEEKIFQSWLGVKLEEGYEGSSDGDFAAHLCTDFHFCIFWIFSA